MSTAADPTTVYRDALQEILRALDPIKTWEEHASDDHILRLTEVVTALRCMNMSGYEPDAIAWHASYLRERMAKLPGAYPRLAIAPDHFDDCVAPLRICGPGCCAPVLGVHGSCPGPNVGAMVVSVR